MDQTPDIHDVVETPTDPPPRRRRLVLATVVVAVMAIGGTALGAGLAGSGSGPAAATTPSTERIEPATQVIHDGDRVEGTGKVVAVDGQPVQFCAPVAETTEGGNDEAHARSCSDAVDVTGVDLAALTYRTTYPGLISGSAHLVGTWHDGSLTDITQSAPVAYVEPLSQPPCAAPAGGWPTGPADENIDLAAASAYQEAHPAQVVTIAMLRPSKTQVVAYVVTSGDPAPVEAALAPEMGPRLCVVGSRYTSAQIDAAVAAVSTSDPMWKDFHVYESGGRGNIGDDGQPEVSVGLQVVTDAVVAAVRDLAPGLVQFEPWLSPSP